MLTLKITKRDSKEDLDILRKSGRTPAVFYGKKDASTSVSVLATDFVKAYKQAGESSVIRLEGDGLSVEALIQDVDFHPVTGKVRHADFYVFEKGKVIEVDVPLEFSGIAPAVKDLGGTLVKVLHSMKIEALPANLPPKIVVDIGTLATFQSVIRASDVKLPEGVKLKIQALEIVASVSEPKEEVEEVVAPVDLSTIEVAKKGKDAKEGEVDATAETGANTAVKAAPGKKEDKSAKK